ncbi:MAG: hypothetical protein KGL39_57805 [Patescibacteria group bacterium]|nr:hypothetical protein [Patescibacteria group bacterium]
MANADHIGVSGKAMYRGIPATTVGWNNGTARTLTVFTDISKTPDADVKSSKDNNGETVEMNRVDKKMKLKFSAKPVSATTVAADAQAIAADLPNKMDILTITAASDASIDTTAGANTCVCDNATAKWSPENELVVDIEATIYIGKAFVAFS